MDIFNSDDWTVGIMLDSGADIDQLDEYGNTLLMSAILGNNIDIVRVLMYHGIDVNRTINGRNALTCVLEQPDNQIDEDIIKELIKYGADVNYLEPVTGFSILMKACILNRKKLNSDISNIGR